MLKSKLTRNKLYLSAEQKLSHANLYMMQQAISEAVNDSVEYLSLANNALFQTKGSRAISVEDCSLLNRKRNTYLLMKKNDEKSYRQSIIREVVSVITEALKGNQVQVLDLSSNGLAEYEEDEIQLLASLLFTNTSIQELAVSDDLVFSAQVKNENNFFGNENKVKYIADVGSPMFNQPLT